MKHYIPMLMLAALSCGAVSCQQEEGLTSPTLAKYSTGDAIKVGKYTIYIDDQNKTASIDKVEFTKGEDVVIPEQITYNNVVYSVTGIGSDHIFRSNDVFAKANSLTLPSTLKSIGSYYFYRCHLNSITIPDSVSYIGKEAFEESKLETIRIPEKVTMLYNRTFQTCNSLVSIDLPEGLTKIEGEVFKGCIALKSINIPSTVTKMGYTEAYTYGNDYTFAACTSLLSAKIPNVETICKNCFDGDTQLQNVTLGTGVKNIEKDAFKDCI